MQSDMLLQATVRIGPAQLLAVITYQITIAHKNNLVTPYNTFSSIKRVKVVLIFFRKYYA